MMNDNLKRALAKFDSRIVDLDEVLPVIKMEIERMGEVIKMAAASVDCCNVWQKQCKVEDLRKTLCTYFGKEYAPQLKPERKEKPEPKICDGCGQKMAVLDSTGFDTWYQSCDHGCGKC